MTDFRFPLQPDPHAAYTYVMPKVTDAKVGFEITGDFPHAAWTEWMTYTGVTGGAQPFSLVKDSAITPDRGSVNPFVPGTAVLADNRGYRLLVLPKGTDQARSPRRSRRPGVERADQPDDGLLAFAVANRVYDAFPGYNQGGAAGPTTIPFPTVRAVDLTTGEGVDCVEPQPGARPQPPTPMPTAPVPHARPVTLSDGRPGAQGRGRLARAAGCSTRPSSTRRTSSSPGHR